jgi:methionyl-tRNA formyltransferase
MGEKNSLNVVLLALTGFGNTVLEALLREAQVNVSAVFTVKYDNPFPYYPEQQLLDLCAARQVVCYHGLQVSSEEGVQTLRRHAPDLIIVATFKQILKQNVIALPSRGVVNFHPSLLPRYRGPCPTNAALLNGDSVTGVTVHYLTPMIDEGNILLQKSIRIDQEDDDGRLRRKLAILAGEMVPEVVEMFTAGRRPEGTPQDNRLATFAPKPTVEDGYLDAALDSSSLARKLKAFNPLPGTSILVGDRRIAIDRFELFQDTRPSGLYESPDAIDVVHGSNAVRLYKKVSS